MASQVTIDIVANAGQALKTIKEVESSFKALNENIKRDNRVNLVIPTEPLEKASEILKKLKFQGMEISSQTINITSDKDLQRITQLTDKMGRLATVTEQFQRAANGYSWDNKNGFASVTYTNDLEVIKQQTEALEKLGEVQNKIRGSFRNRDSSTGRMLGGDYIASAQQIKEQISSIEGMENAEVKAIGTTNVLGQAWEQYSVSVKNADNTTSNSILSINKLNGEVRQTASEIRGLVMTEDELRTKTAAQASQVGWKEWSQYQKESENIFKFWNEYEQSTSRIFSDNSISEINAYAETIDRIGNTIGEINGKASLNFLAGSGNVSDIKNQIAQIDNLDASLLKVNGTVKVAGQTFQQFTYQVKNDDGTVSTFRYHVDEMGNVFKKFDGYSEPLNRASEGIKQVGNSAEDAGKKAHTLGQRIKAVVANLAISAIARTVTSSFREALKTMKEVDAELANIKKVTDWSNSKMSSVSKSAYSTASNYGVSASDYLTSVGTMAKAGYRDTAEALAELSTKTQLVGDVTADIADQFLIAADAAWKFNGDATKLSTVLDQANVIENNYATSIEKLAEGFPRVASVASMAHMSIEETMSALGTITAVTQETGTKAGTALRALILNILKDTTTEIEDGVTLTEENLEDLSDVVAKYADNATKAKIAAGELIDPMETIGQLAKAYKDNVMTDADMYKLVQSLGGKLRTNQLQALLANWDMYTEMLEKTKNSAGSADKEIGVMLDTWEAKLNILKNTWTEFIQSTISTNGIKGLLDFATGFLNAFGNLNSVLTVTVGLLAAFKLEKIFTGFEKLGSKISSVVVSIKNLANGVMVASDALNIMQASLAAIALVTAAYTIISNEVRQAQERAMQANKDAAESAAIEASGIRDSYVAYKEAKDAYDSGLGSKEAYTSATQALSEALGEEIIAADGAASSIKNLTLEELNKSLADTKVNVADARNALNEAFNSWNVFKNSLNPAGSYKTAIVGFAENFGFQYDGDATKNANALLKVYQNLREEQSRLAKEGLDSGSYWNDIEAELSILEPLISDYIDATGRYTDIQKMMNEVMNDSGVVLDENGNVVSNAAAQYDSLTGSVEGAKSAIEAFNSAVSEEPDDQFKGYADAYDKFLEAWNEGLTGSNAVKEAIKLFFGDDAINAAHGDIEKLGKTLSSDFMQTIFSAEDSADRGSIFAYELWDNVAESYEDGAKVIKNANGEIVASLKETDDGLQVTVDDYEGLSEALEGVIGEKLEPDFLKAWMSALGMVGNEISYSKDEIMEYAESLNALNQSGQIDMSKLISGLASVEGMDSKQIWDIVNSILQLDDLDIKDIDFGVDVENTEEAEEAVEGLIEKTLGLDGTVAKVEIDADVEAAKAKVEELSHPIDGAIDIKVGADTSDAEGDAENAESNIESMSPELTIDGNANKAISAATAAVNLINAMSATIKIVTQKIDHNASGTDNAEGGLSLVNEEGAEIIQYGSQAWIAGGGLPTITDIPAGAMVFNADETKQILSRSGVGYDVFKNAIGSHKTVSGVQRYNGATKSGYATSTKTYSAGSSKSSYSTGTNSSSGGNKDLAEEQEDEIKRLEDIVKLRKSELSLIEAQNGSVADQIAKEKQIQSAIKDQIRYMESIGAEQAEINDLYTEWYEINKKIDDLQRGMLDELSDAIDEEIDSLEELRDAELKEIDDILDSMEKERDTKEDQLELEEKILAVQKAQANLQKAMTERTVRYYNASTGQWEWGAKAGDIKSAQEALDDAKKALEDYQEDKAYEAEKAALEAQKDEINAKYDALVKDWKDIMKDMEEPVKNIEEALAEIANNATTDLIPTLKVLNQKLEKFGYAIDTGSITRSGSGTTIVTNASKYGTYDSGGILSGLGGIKATAGNEIILPPDITSKMLSPNANGTFMERLGELRFLYGVTADGSKGGNGLSNYGDVHNGNVYKFGNITIGEDRARSMSVYDMVKMSRGLRIYNAC